MGALAEGIAADWAVRPPELVHAHFWMSGAAALEAVRLHEARSGRRVPMVQTFHALGTVKRRHQGEGDTSPVERSWVEPRVGTDADAIVATCSDELVELAAMGVDTAKAVVVPCGVDARSFTPVGEAEGRWRRGHVIAAVGRLVPRKGVDDAILALAELRRRGRRDVDLLVVGGSADRPVSEDPEARRLAEVARRAGVAGSVRFRGQVPHDRLGSVLRAVDVVVCTPWYEPFGIVPLEAMACGVPVVASAVGGLTDTVVAGRTGLLVPPRDIPALADALEELLDDPQARRRMGAAGRERVLERYRWDVVAESTLELYERLVDAVAEAPLAGRAGGGRR